MNYRVSTQLLIDVQAIDETAAKEEVLRQLGEGGIGGDDIVWLEVAELHERQSREDRLDDAAKELTAANDAWHEQEDELQSLRSRLQECELERDKYRAALMADRGEEAANRIRDEDRAFCLLHQTYYDSDIGCAKCVISERAVEAVSLPRAAP